MMEIPLSPSNLSGYNLFYGLAIAAAVVILLAEGRKRKFHSITWSLVIATSLVAFIVGCTFITLKKDEWQLVFQNQLLHQHVGASMLGGLLFSIPVIIFFKLIYRYDLRMLDAFAFILPVGMAIQRLGCLYAGCCYGTTCELPWSVTYLWAGESVSLHPVQLYEVIGCVFSVILIKFGPRFLQRPGSLFLFSGICYFITRFTCEFFRAHQAHIVGGEYFFGFNSTQIAMFLLSLTAFALIIWIESRPTKSSAPKNIQQSTVNSALHLVLLIFIVAITGKWLRTFDVIVLGILISLPAAHVLWQLYRKFVMVPTFRFASMILISLSIVMMSQSSAPDVTKQKTIDRYNTISFGVSGQQLEFSKETGTSSGDCGTTPIYTYFNIRNTTGAAALARTWVKENNVSYTLGLNTYLSTLKETISSGTQSKNNYTFIGSKNFTFIGFNPSFTTTGRYAEFTIGAHVGDLRRIRTDFDETADKSLLGHSVIYPQIGFRLGNVRTFFVNAQAYNSPAGVIPSSPVSIGFGSGFGNQKGDHVELGHSSFALLYATGRITANENLSFKPYIGFGNGLFNSFKQRGNGFSFAVSFSTKLRRKDKDVSKK